MCADPFHRQLPPGFFSSRHHEGPDSRSILRFLHYPSIPPGAQVDPNRAGAHSDYGSLTLLFQRKNGGEGLQILPPSEPLDGGKWQDTGIVNDALLVNVGDALELWSGARLKSTLHRVRELSHSDCRPYTDVLVEGRVADTFAGRRCAGALLDRLVQPADARREPSDVCRRHINQRECVFTLRQSRIPALTVRTTLRRPCEDGAQGSQARVRNHGR